MLRLRVLFRTEYSDIFMQGGQNLETALGKKPTWS